MFSFVFNTQPMLSTPEYVTCDSAAGDSGAVSFLSSRSSRTQNRGLVWTPGGLPHTCRSSCQEAVLVIQWRGVSPPRFQMHFCMFLKHLLLYDAIFYLLCCASFPRFLATKPKRAVAVALSQPSSSDGLKTRVKSGPDTEVFLVKSPKCNYTNKNPAPSQAAADPQLVLHRRSAERAV